MLFVTTQPDSDYYIWQLQVQLNNFKKFGCEDKSIVVFGYNPVIGINPKAKDLQKSTTAKVYFFPDERNLSERLYLPSIRPHLLKQLFKSDPDLLCNQNFLYFDCDVIFSNYPDFSSLIDKKIIHLSDTTKFLTLKDVNSDTLLFQQMCHQVGISLKIVKSNKEKTGGIIYMFKDIHYFDFEFWDKVERDSVQLYKMMLVANSADDYKQIMTANQLSMLWNLWLMGYDTELTKELSVSWATNPIGDWTKNNLFNDAGVEEKDREFLFYKGDFHKITPFDTDLSYVSKEHCSIKYVEEIITTGNALKSEN